MRAIYNRLIAISALLCIAVVFLAGCGVPEAPLPVETESQGISEPLGRRDSSQNALAYLDGEYRVMDGFSTHLPLLVVRQDESIDFYPDAGSFSSETLSAPSALRAQGTMQWSRDATANRPNRDKADYAVYVPADTLAALQGSLWGAPVHQEWMLLGNMYDKSLLRNYLALTLAGEMGIASSLVQFCEVVGEVDGELVYQGVYLLAAPPVTESYQFQRGNYQDTDSLPLNTYASRENILVEGLYIPSAYPLDAGQQQRLSDEVSRAEQSIFSGDYNQFSQYTRYLNSQQMYDYFILYELFGNYAGGHLPRYSFNPQAGTFGPVALADFEFSLDNEQNEPMDFYSVHMMETPYYTALVKNTNFIREMIDRYRQLYQGVLNSSSIENRIDQSIQLLGEAQMRDWARWKAMYDGVQMYGLTAINPNPAGDSLPPVNRNTYDYSQEINKLKYSLKEHGQYMFGGMATLYDQEDMMGDDAPYVRNTWMFVVSLFIVVLSVRIVRHRTR